MVIDGKDHLVGRLASIVAKNALNGQKVVVVRCESLVLSGSHFRNKLKYAEYLRKRCVVNPTRGPVHFRAPSRMFYRVLRGMVPHKTPRGAAALARVKLFEGVPAPYDKVKRVVVPDALRVLRLKPGRKWCRLDRLAAEVGWKYRDVVAALEAKRKAKALVFYEAKKKAAKAKATALKTAAPELSAVTQQLSLYGH